MTQSKTAGDLATLVNGRLVGDIAVPIERIADLETAGERDIAYVDNAKFFVVAEQSDASCLLVPSTISSSVVFRAPAIIQVANPKLAFSLVAQMLHPPVQREAAIHPTAIVAGSAVVSSSAYVGPHA